MITYEQLRELPYNDLLELNSKITHLLRVKNRKQKKLIPPTEVKEGDVIKINKHKEGCIYKVERTNRTRVTAREMNTGIVYNVPYSSVEIITQKQPQ